MLRMWTGKHETAIQLTCYIEQTVVLISYVCCNSVADLTEKNEGERGSGEPLSPSPSPYLDLNHIELDQKSLAWSPWPLPEGFERCCTP